MALADNLILKKRLSTYRTDNGRLTKISDEVLVDILRAWEGWTGSSKEFYQSVGLTKEQLGVVIKKGKKLTRNGVSGEFKELKLDSLIGTPSSMVGPIEVSWDKGKTIRFSQVEQLVDFLKKVA
jgi:hypothetical protein